jgi:hypothetical protein
MDASVLSRFHNTMPFTSSCPLALLGMSSVHSSLLGEFVILVPAGWKCVVRFVKLFDEELELLQSSLSGTGASEEEDRADAGASEHSERLVPFNEHLRQFLQRRPSPLPSISVPSSDFVGFGRLARGGSVCVCVCVCVYG